MTRPRGVSIQPLTLAIEIAQIPQANGAVLAGREEEAIGGEGQVVDGTDVAGNRVEGAQRGRIPDVNFGRGHFFPALRRAAWRLSILAGCEQVPVWRLCPGVKKAARVSPRRRLALEQHFAGRELQD